MSTARRWGRREAVAGGLAGLAALVVGRRLLGCSKSSSNARDGGEGPMDAAADATDAQPRDSASMMPDAAMAETPFTPNEMPAGPMLRSRIAEIGPLGEPDSNGVRLPAGFRSSVVARSGEPVPGTDLVWHVAPDGGACFPTMDGGWIYVSNSEIPRIGRISGGVGAIRFDASGRIVSAARILDGTSFNCAGGMTPWGSWLSCEEFERGRVFECDPWGVQRPQVRAALGVFQHEAVAVDPMRGHLYMTEDESDGCFYRFTPSRALPDLREGTLEVASVADDGSVRWHRIADPGFTGSTPVRWQVEEATAFDGGEGIWWHDDVVYFTTKGDHRVWAYDCASQRIRVLYDGRGELRGVDNVTVSCCGDVLVAEDGGDMQIVAVLPDGSLRVLLQIVGQDRSEITGPAFDPSGTRLYFSSQRGGPRNEGITYVVEGPFHERV
ncbi:MAG: PhoX family protein [Myxococcota bacterium]|nr:PhoX family protein [Myxococcota bacterium]MDW8362934.1 DUF839 domain-containing protein [Myxococcales bacterium]